MFNVTIIAKVSHKATNLMLQARPKISCSFGQLSTNRCSTRVPSVRSIEVPSTSISKKPNKGMLLSNTKAYIYIYTLIQLYTYLHMHTDPTSKLMLRTIPRNSIHGC